jgi:hypothetical protein
LHAGFLFQIERSKHPAGDARFSPSRRNTSLIPAGRSSDFNT